MALGGAWRNELVAPGPLSVHHAHLADGANATMRCAECHEGASGTIGEWLGIAASSNDATSDAVTQSDLCMKCHKASIQPALATAAHNIPWKDLVQTASGHGRRDASAAIACSACHREHQGRMHDLTAMTDAACQACHQEEYLSFAEGHPDFGNWPYKRRTRIMFDHASHQLKHHPAREQHFACADCHVADATGTRQLTRDFATSCASCHDKALGVSLADGVPLIALPTLDVAALADANADAAPWPAAADGDFDGAIPLFGKLLLTADSDTATALAALGPRFDYYDVDPDDEPQLRQAAAIANALRELIEDLASRGDEAISERLAAVLGRELTNAELAAISARLSPAAVAAYRDRWFGEASGENDPTPTTSAPGGWFRNDASFSLRYQPTGHADPWLRAWLDALAEAATGPRAEVAEPLLRAALLPTAPGQCGSCHSIERDAAGKLAIQWSPDNGGTREGDHGLTYFSHAAHVLQSQLSDCTACHKLVSQPATAPTYATDDPRQFLAGFETVSKSMCASCHTPTAAGDRCTLCHRYHGESGQWAAGSGQ